jgi:hypothetical protein
MNIYDKIVLTYAQSIDLGLKAEQLKDGRWVAPISDSLKHPDLANAPILPQEEYGRLKADVLVVEVQPSLPLDSFVDKE